MNYKKLHEVLTKKLDEWMDKLEKAEVGSIDYDFALKNVFELETEFLKRFGNQGGSSINLKIGDPAPYADEKTRAVLFVSEGCPWCEKLKEKLIPIFDTLEVPYVEINTSGNQDEQFKDLGIQKTPITMFVKDMKVTQFVEGYDEGINAEIVQNFLK